MRIGIQTWGSDGDILPFIALAKGLNDAGHKVSVVYTSVDNKDYASFSTNSGISMVKAFEKFHLPREKVLSDILYTRNILKELALTLKYFFDPAVEAMYAAAKQLTHECDLVIGHVIHYPLAIAAEKARRPRVSVALCPLIIGSAYTSPLGPSFGKGLNALLWKLADFAARRKMYIPAQRLRKKEGLAPYRDLQSELYVSKALTLIATCKPLCTPMPDWGEHIQVSGFLNPPQKSADWVMPKALRAFLEDGAPPVYFTFGSITQFDIQGTTRLFLEAARKAGVRAIIQSHWDQFQTTSEDPDIYPAPPMPHEQVFPHCSMIVHHGGSGTTQSSLRAGKPSIVVAHAFDQTYWGKRLHRMGVGGKVLQRRTATAERLADGIRMILRSPQISRKAQKLGRSVRAENGVGEAVAKIQTIFG